MSNDVFTPLLQGAAVVHRGTVMSVDLDGTIRVAVGSDSNETLACQVLRTSAVPPAVEPGDAVIYLVTREDPGTGYVLGVVDLGEFSGRSPGAARGKEGAPLPKQAPARLVLEGKEEVILRTGRATIVLRANGDVEIRGRRIVSRARNLQKLSAPMLKLN